MFVRMRLTAFFLILQALDLVTSVEEEIKCDANFQVTIKPKLCCRIPAFFSDAELQFCHITKTDVLDPLTCNQRSCLLKTRYLMNEFDIINRNAVLNFLDHWLIQNAKWNSSIIKAKQRCFGNVIPISDLHCSSNKLFYCIIATLFEDCPAWLYELEDCYKLRKFVDACIKLIMEKLNEYHPINTPNTHSVAGSHGRR